MDNTIIFRLCDEDRARLDKIIDALARMTAPTVTTQAETEPADSPVEPLREAESKPAEEPTPAPVESATAAQAAEEEPTVTLEQIRQLAIKLTAGTSSVRDQEGQERAKARKEQARAIINAHAAKISDLPADKWAEVWEQLTQLEKEDA